MVDLETVERMVAEAEGRLNQQLAEVAKTKGFINQVLAFGIQRGAVLLYWASFIMTTKHGLAIKRNS